MTGFTPMTIFADAKHLLWTIGLVGCVLTTPAAAQLEKTSVAIPAVSFAFTADYIAEDAHLYEQNGLDVKIQFLAGNAGFNALISGAVDFSFSSGTNLDRAAAKGQKMLAIANMNN